MLSITNKMQHNTTFFIAVKALHVSGGFPAHHQGLKNCTYSIWYMSSLLAATSSMGELELGKPPETCRALTAIKNVVLCCIFLVLLSIY